MKVLYIYRHPDMGYSIGKVFRPIEEEMKKHAEVDSIYLPIPNYSLKGLWKNIRYVQEYCKKNNYGAIHITGAEHYLLPFLRNKRTIITVHDFGFFTNNKLSYKNIVKYLFWIKTLPLASHVTFISEKSKNEGLGLVKLREGKYSVIMNPVATEFKTQKKNINIHCPTILQIGTGSNKNIESTAIALKGFPCKLRIIGKLTDKQKFILNLYNITYECKSNLTDEEILQEYNNCDIVNFPSLYEGFGMPIIEGQSIGRPVLTSNLSPMKEIAADSAILVDPTCPESIRKGFEALLKDSLIYIEKGLENIKRFSLQHISKEYFEIYNKIQ